jgi:aminopeptidase N
VPGPGRQREDVSSHVWRLPQDGDIEAAHRSPQPYKINLPSRRIRTVSVLLPWFAKNELRQYQRFRKPGAAPLRRPTPSTHGLNRRSSSGDGRARSDLCAQSCKVTAWISESVTRGFSEVYVKPARAIAAGSAFQVVVAYSGKPGEYRQGDVKPWFATDGEWTIAGEPDSSAWWYPANDHPSDRALMDVSIRVPAGLQAISMGRLESPDKQGIDHGVPYVYAVSDKLPAEQRKTAFAALMTSGERIRLLETMFGPYPFTELGGVVPAPRLWFGGLETQTRPVYEARSILNRNFEPGLLDHGLAHMWYGDNVTVRQWEDIFTNEAYASWAQWEVTERSGGRKANDTLNRAYERLKNDEAFWKITMIDPGKAHLFDAVYIRGPMTPQALRNIIGDEAFFKLATDWAQDPESRTLEEWVAAAQSHTTIDLGPFFRDWIYASAAPARTAANGFR